MTAELLMELGTEELPPSALKGLLESLPEALAAELDAAGIEHGTATGFASPRHLGVRVAAVARHQADRVIDRKGPALSAAFDAHGEPTRAASGFARSCGVSVGELERVTTDKGEWLAYRAREPGATTAELLPDLVARTVSALPLPKRMRWGAGEAAFIRPVHWLVLMHGEDIVPCDLFGVRAGRHTRGHRFHHPDWVGLDQPSDYQDRLVDARVLVDFDTRRERIRAAVRAQGEAVGGEAQLDEELLDEVTALVEWPVALAGSFDTAFLRVPPEALVSSMEGHQKYFPVRDTKGALMARFVTVANLESRDPAQVVAGNERVIRPRLADAAFFWDQDRRYPLEQRLEGLRSVVFQQSLGSLYDKSVRVARLAGDLAERAGEERQTAERAGLLCKADLLTEMVDEFPELQGVMGRYYALESGEPEAVAQALDEVYRPRFAGDSLPVTATGRTVALADRLDTLVGLFGIGKPPTGAKDPFGLRRAALGVLRITIEGGIDVDLVAAAERAAAAFREDGIELADDTPRQVHDFLLERLRAYYLDQGVAHDSFDAVAQQRPNSALDFERRLRAVEAFRRRPEADALTAANKRIRNILRKGNGTVTGAQEVDEALLEADAESGLLRALRTAETALGPRIAEADYGGALDELAGLRPSVDRFFDEVLVMADDERIRANRFALLSRLAGSFLHVADISRLQD